MPLPKRSLPQVMADSADLLQLHAAIVACLINIVMSEWVVLREAPMPRVQRVTNLIQAIIYFLTGFAWEIFIQQGSALLVCWLSHLLTVTPVVLRASRCVCLTR